MSLPPPPPALISFTDPIGLAIGLALVMAAIATGLYRSVTISRTARLALATGASLLALACGEPVARRTTPADVAVMIDVSPSTRSAGYHDTQMRVARIGALLGNSRFRTYQFASANQLRESAASDPAIEMACDQTDFAPPADASAVLLFSDGQFASETPAAVPTYVVVDSNLDHTGDAAVTQIRLRDPDPRVSISVRVDGEPRQLRLTGVLGSSQEQLEAGMRSVSRERDVAAPDVRAQLAGTDRWPENDELSIVAPPELRRARWWIGSRDPGPTWEWIRPENLASDAASFLLPAVIALDDVAVDALTVPAVRALSTYVRDLGGSLLILGGNHAFAAGGYAGSTLDAISPLGSVRPQPTTHWIVLIDASGSMAAVSGIEGRSRWDVAVEALHGLLSIFPPDEPLSAGSFSRDLKWWFQNIPARDAPALPFPPRDTLPQGPTNLSAALAQIAGKSTGKFPTELLILSDADASIDHADALAKALKSTGVRVHLLATSAIDDSSPVRTVVSGTDGQIIAQPDAARWASDLQKLVRAAQPDELENSEVQIEFLPELRLPRRSVTPSNRTWPRLNVETVASATVDGTTRTMAAAQRVGLGQVVAVAFSPTLSEADVFAARFARTPRDPRYRVRWQFGREVVMTIDAIDPETRAYMNDLAPELRMTNEAGAIGDAIAVPQIAPGQYELRIPASRSSRLATVVLEDHLIDRAAIAGRFPAEFDAIGNDRAALRRIAERSGGRLIEPNEARAIDFPARFTRQPLATALAVAGFAAISLGLFAWRRSG